MVTDSLEDLGRLGIDGTRVRLVALLPLIRVAWADARIQRAERNFILEVAHRHGLLDDGARPIVEGWLDEPPSGSLHQVATRVLRELSARAELPEGLDGQDIVAICWALASAAGGLFGTRLFAIGGRERQALEEIAEGLGVGGIEAVNQYWS